MQEQRISFETAKLASESGYDNGCEYIYTYPNGELKHCAAECYNIEMDRLEFEAPTQSVLQKWLRDEHCIEVIVKSWIEGKELCYLYSVQELGKPSSYMNKNNFKTYEEALEEGLMKGIELRESKIIVN